MSRATRLALALADHTASNLLQQLADDEDAEVRRAVASNPNTPQDVLLTLGREFPDAIVANPIFNILLLENPESLFVRLSLARSSTSSETLVNLSALPDEEILCAIAENSNTPVATLAQLVQNPPQIYDYDDPDGSEFDRLFTCVAKNPNTPASLLIRLANHSGGSVRYVVAEHPNTPVSILDRFADSSNVEMHRAILRNPNTPTMTLERLAGQEVKETRDRVKMHPNVSEMAIAIVNFMDEKPETPLHLLPTFATHSRPAVRRLVAAHPHTPSTVLDQLSLDLDDGVRHKVGEHPNASATALEHVAEWLVTKHQQSSPSNRQGYEHSAIALVKRSNITSKVLETLLRMGVIKVAVAIAACKAAPPETLLKFIESEEQFQEPSFWSILAGNPNTPVEGLEILFSRLELARDSQRGLYEIARHPNVSVQLLKKLAPRCLQNPNLCSLMLKNPTMPGELLRWLANHPHIKETYNAEALIAEHPNTPVDLLLRFVTDPSVYIRQGLASNINAPVAILETLADDEDESVHANLLANPSTPVDILERFAAHLQNERFGESLINNPGTPAKLLALLVDAPNRKIRQGVAAHPNASADTVMKLAADQNYLVRQAILQRSDLTESVIETLAEKTFAQAEADKPERMDEWNVPGGRAMTLSEMLRASTAGKAFAQADPQEQDKIDEANVSGKAAHPVSSVQEGLAKTNYGDILEGLASHPKTPVHILEKLATNQPEILYRRFGDALFRSIRKAVASNINAPISILEQLAGDEQPNVGAAAQKTLRAKV